MVEGVSSRQEESSHYSCTDANSRGAIASAIEYHLEVDQSPCRQQRQLFKDEEDDAAGTTITWSRRVARYLSRFSWYYPSRSSSDDGPCLDEGWHHYEHVILPRCYRKTDEPLVPPHSPQTQQSHLTPSNSTNSSSLLMAGIESTSPILAAAEKEEVLQQQQNVTTTPISTTSKLYPIIGSPLQDLSNFGVSTRMYLSSLLVLAGILGLSGLGNIPLMAYYWGYSPENKDGVHYMGVTSIRSSAICDATVWVECESCHYPQYAQYFPSYRLDDTGLYARKNSCNFDDFWSPGLWSFASTCLLILLMAIASLKQQKVEVVFDEAVQTASDYSICVRNPPNDALDPDEWRRFFNKYAVEGKGVALVTVAINNADLLKLLIKRRKALQTLSQNLPEGIDVEQQPWQHVRVVVEAMPKKPSVLSYIGLATDVHQLVNSIEQCEMLIRNLLHERTFKPSAVFVTFETERSQRNALHALSTGKLNIWRQELNPASVHNDGVLRVYESMRNSAMSDLANPQMEHVIQLTVSDSRDLDYSSALLFRNCHVLHVKEAVEPSDVRWLDLESSKRLELYVASTIGMMLTCSVCGLYIYRLVKRFPGPYATMFITLVSRAGRWGRATFVVAFSVDTLSHAVIHEVEYCCASHL